MPRPFVGSLRAFRLIAMVDEDIVIYGDQRVE